jgi:hypothetical protein
MIGSGQHQDAKYADDAKSSAIHQSAHRLQEWECNMTALSGFESQYDAFLFASLCETDEMTLSVVSLLARQDVDPWQEAARLTQLPRAQAINSLAATISQSNSGQWSQSEANTMATRLIELLPSHSRSNAAWGDDGNGRLTYWMVAWLLFLSLAMSGNNMQKATGYSSTPATGVSMAAQDQAVTNSSRGNGTD